MPSGGLVWCTLMLRRAVDGKKRRGEGGEYSQRMKKGREKEDEDGGIHTGKPAPNADRTTVLAARAVAATDRYTSTR